MEDEYEILKRIRQEKGTMIAEIMSNEMKKDVLVIELKRFDEIVPFVNEGMKDAIHEEQEAIVLIRNNEKTVDITSNDSDYTKESTFTMRNESGDIVGELITDEEELEELRDDPDVYFLSDNFVKYNNLKKFGEREFFVLEGEHSDFFTSQDLESLVASLTVAIPSTETDHYIKDCFDIPHDENIGTLIIGFTPL